MSSFVELALDTIYCCAIRYVLRLDMFLTEQVLFGKAEHIACEAHIESRRDISQIPLGIYIASSFGVTK